MHDTSVPSGLASRLPLEEADALVIAFEDFFDNTLLGSAPAFCWA